MINEQIVDFERIDIDGNIESIKISKTVDLVTIFSIQNEDQALSIADFLTKRASALEPDAIEDSFEVPDIRATRALREILKRVEFEEVTANILTSNHAQLIVGRQSSTFPEPWINIPIEMNEELADYLASRGVLP